VSVAIVHDYVTQRGGAERVVLSMIKAFPNAPLHTSLFHPAGTFPQFAGADVRTSPLDRVGILRRNHRLALPLMAPVFSGTQIHADVVLCSSSGWAHGIRTTGRKIVYCYSPARWLYQHERYVGPGQSLQKIALAVLRPPLVRWDKRKAATANRYLTLSTVVRDRLWHTYRIEAEVLPPPHTIDVDGRARLVPGTEPGFFLCVARLLPYKNVDAVVATFRDLPQERLVVVGTGPEGGRLVQLAGPNVTFVGSVDDDRLRWLYRNCTAVVSASHEDYGLTPLEAAAFGKPSVVLHDGGFLDTVVEDETGIFFEHPAPSEILPAIRRLLAQTWWTPALQAHAARFDEHRFVRRLQEVAAEGD
jgi:glycosyltransferase involved in cell wall biosynthesis